MKKFKNSSFYILTIFVIFQMIEVQANVFEAWDTIKNKCAIVRSRTQYYMPYLIVPTVGIVLGKYINKSLGIASVGGYVGYAALSGMRNIHNIQKKYERKEYAQNDWHKGTAQANIFYFARWRQCNEGDGMYWTTAWQLHEDFATVKTQFLRDLYAGKFVIFNAQGQLIHSPTPQQVFNAMRDELQEIARDRESLVSLTDVYYAISQPEEFHPDVSYTRYLWPNYNAASQLYIELDVMMKRLEKLCEVVAELRASVGGQGWPKIR